MADDFRLVSLLNPQIALTAGPAISAGANSQNTGTIVFSNSNGFTFGMAGGTVTASVQPGAAAGIAQINAGTTSASSGTVTFGSSAGNVTFGMANGFITASAPSGGGGNLNVTGANGSSTNSVSTIVFSNLNGMTLGVATGANIVTVTGSYTVPTQSNQTVGLYISSNTTGASSSTTIDARSFSVIAHGDITLGLSAGMLIFDDGGDSGNMIAASGSTASNHATVVFSNSNNVSFGLGGASNSVMTASASFPAQTAYVFSNSNGVSFGTNGSTVTATVQTNYLTTARASNDALGLNTAQSNVTWTANSSGLSIDARGYAGTVTSFGGTNVSGSLTLNSGGLTVSLSAPAVGGAQTGISGIVASNTTFTSGTVSFSNANGFSFGTSASGANQVITGSYTVPTQSVQTQASGAIAGTGFSSTTTAGTAIVATLNTAGLSLNYPVFITNALTTAAQTSASNVSLIIVGTNNAGGGTASLSGAVSFSNANSLTFYSSAGNAIVASFSTSQSVQTQASGNIAGSGFTTSSTGGSVLVGTQNSAGLSLLVPAWLTAAAGGGVAISASGNSVSAGTVVFSNSNGVSFGMSGSTVTATVQPGAAAGIAAINNSNTTYTSGTVQLTEGGGAITIASNTGQRFAFSVPATSSLVGSNGITLSSNGSTISVMEQNIQTYVPYYPGSTATQTLGAINVTSASAFFFPFQVINPIQFNALQLLCCPSNSTSATAASGGQTITSSWGLYTNNASTLSQISSGSFSLALTLNSNSGTLSYPSVTATNSYTYTTLAATTTAQMQSLWGTAGNKLVNLVFGNSMSLSQGNYWLGVMRRQTSVGFNVGINDAVGGNVWAAAQNLAPFGVTSSANTTAFVGEAFHPFGVYTSTGSANYGGTALPVSAFMSGFQNTATIMPMFTFIST